MQDFKVNNATLINKEDLKILQRDLESDKIFSGDLKVLKEKLNLIILHSAFQNNIAVEYDIKLYEAINATDFSLIKEYLLEYSRDKDDKYFMENKIIKKEFRLSLYDIIKDFLNSEKELFGQDIEISSIKIFDYLYEYNDYDKNKVLAELKKIFNYKIKTRNIDIISNINEKYTYNFLKDILHLEETKVNIKYINRNDNKYSYISSIFYLIIKFKIGTNYKIYFIYYEPEINLAYSTFVKNESIAHFLQLLEKRFQEKINNKYIINFNQEIYQKSFDFDLSNILVEINNLLKNNEEKSNIDTDKLLQKIDYLRLYYPKTDFSYRLLKNIVQDIILAKQIQREKNLENEIENTKDTIRKIMKKNIFSQRNKIYKNIPDKEIEINIFLLRKSIFVNKFGNSNLSICDIFNDLYWSSLDEILNSLDEIYKDKSLLDRFFGFLNFKSKSLKAKQEKYSEIVKNYINTGKKIIIT